MMVISVHLEVTLGRERFFSVDNECQEHKIDIFGSLGMHDENSTWVSKIEGTLFELQSNTDIVIHSLNYLLIFQCYQ